MWGWRGSYIRVTRKLNQARVWSPQGWPQLFSILVLGFWVSASSSNESYTGQAPPHTITTIMKGLLNILYVSRHKVSMTSCWCQLTSRKVIFRNPKWAKALECHNIPRRYISWCPKIIIIINFCSELIIFIAKWIEVLGPTPNKHKKFNNVLRRNWSQLVELSQN